MRIPLIIGMLTAVLGSGCAAPRKVEVSLEEKIGQMLMVSFRGLSVDKNHPVIQDIQKRHVGAVILFDYDVPGKSPVRNIASPSQVRKLVSDLQAASSRPLLVAIDQEGGKVCRLKEKYGFPPTLSAKQMGRKKPEATYAAALAMAQTLKEAGINLNLAPVVDLNRNRKNPVIGKLGRSFSPDPDRVTDHARQFILAHHDQGVLCALKHFPGHGSSTSDSHKGFTDVTPTWSPMELQPYRQLIAEGLADTVLTAHVFNANLDPDHPATLSRSVIAGRLRGELGFDGVVISDDLQMGAIAQHYDLETTLKNAIDAGVDILLFANNSSYDEQIASKVVALVSEMVRKRQISEARIEDSFRRIQRLKAGL
ncbi:glycoside hydrolase family 3 N-terminal domain-containing protein [Desulfuromonas sp.]|uniref:glycoside hydrolase family 3 protein n=1 Tax=Desulfuromonas sp. TaxID=892 RepID=UPI0025BE536A|nr:glycoside hydrolase family 3 N-terminal domain-containing protein [Desulfuromonas sp.]